MKLLVVLIVVMLTCSLCTVSHAFSHKTYETRRNRRHSLGVRVQLRCNEDECLIRKHGKEACSKCWRPELSLSKGTW